MFSKVAKTRLDTQQGIIDALGKQIHEINKQVAAIIKRQDATNKRIDELDRHRRSHLATHHADKTDNDIDYI